MAGAYALMAAPVARGRDAGKRTAVPRQTSIEAALRAAGAELHGVRVFDARLGDIRLDPDIDSLIIGVRPPTALAALKTTLERAYPSDHPVTVVSRAGSKQQATQTRRIADLEGAAGMPPTLAVFVPALPAERRGTVDGLRAIMARLRGPDGCPWDREQDHRTLRRCLLEEVHEALDAIDREDWQDLASELGDILLQVMFHAQLASERGEFDFDDVAERLRGKLVVRHPHVFGDAVAKDAATVLRRWDEIKREEVGGEGAADLLTGVAPTLPALDRAQKVQRRAAHFGFDWAHVEGPLAKLAEEIEELTAALGVEAPGSPRLEHEIGDVLFAAVNVARFAGVDAEQALRTMVERFARRFAVMQKLAAEQGQRIEGMNLEQMDALWEKAKKSE
jgi:tetrapyrrole methylase family protein/MazG family protein